MHYRNPFIEICIEGAASAFRILSHSEKELLDQNHLVLDYRKGETIINGGSRPKGLTCLVSGKAKLFKVGAGNREQIIKMLRPHNYLSYRPLYSDAPFPFTVSAIEETTVVVLDKNTVTKILRHNAELAVRFMRIISEDVILTDNRLVSLTQKHVRGRLAESILYLRDTYGAESEGTIKVLLSREDIAHLSNMTTSNAIRTLSEFITERILEVEGRKIMIVNLQKLEAISESGQ